MYQDYSAGSLHDDGGSIHDYPPPVVYGQKLSKTRCLTAVRGDALHHRFIVGTVSLHSSSNEIHLLEYCEENDDVLCRKLFHNHSHEIWNMSCSPLHSDLLFTVYNEGRAGYKASLWRMHGVEDSHLGGDDDDDDDNDMNGSKSIVQSSTSSNVENGSGEHTDLECLATIDSQEGVMHDVLWEPLTSDRVVTVENMMVREWHVEHDAQQPLQTEKNGTEFKVGRRIHCGKWNPIDRDMVSVGAGSRVVHLDLRQKKPAQTVNNAHAQRIQDIDFNPWKQYYMATGGDDGFVKFWDMRNSSEPVRVLGGHSHWVCKVKYNPTHDDLLLSCSTDCIINLWRMHSVSSKYKLADDSAANAELGQQQDPLVKDCLLRTIDENEESVYAIDWSSKNPWLFASVSYDGRVLIHHVPPSEKDRLLLGTGDDLYGDDDFHSDVDDDNV